MALCSFCSHHISKGWYTQTTEAEPSIVCGVCYRRFNKGVDPPDAAEAKLE